MTIKDSFSPIYKDLFNETVTGARHQFQQYSPFKQEPGKVNTATIVYNILREMYDKSMSKFSRPLPSSNIKFSAADRKAFLNKLRGFAARFDGEFLELDSKFEKVLEKIKATSSSQRTADGKPIADRPAEILPWTKEVEVKVVSGKVFEKAFPNMIGRRFVKINGRDSYENVMEIIKVKI